MANLLGLRKQGEGKMGKGLDPVLKDTRFCEMSWIQNEILSNWFGMTGQNDRLYLMG